MLQDLPGLGHSPRTFSFSNGQRPHAGADQNVAELPGELPEICLGRRMGVHAFIHGRTQDYRDPGGQEKGGGDTSSHGGVPALEEIDRCRFDFIEPLLPASRSVRCSVGVKRERALPRQGLRGRPPAALPTGGVAQAPVRLTHQKVRGGRRDHDGIGLRRK